MSVIDIVMLVAGAAVFIASFIVPVKQEELKEETKKLAQTEVKALVDQETEKVRARLDDMAEDTVQTVSDKAQRAMERISNEKIMAVNEYSDTVLAEIHKNHQEVVFLYDMLNDKQETLKKTVSDADADVKKLLRELKDTQVTVEMQSRENNTKPEYFETVDEAEQEEFSEVEEIVTNQNTAQKERTEAAEADFTDFTDFTALTPKKVQAVPKKTPGRKTLNKTETKVTAQATKTAPKTTRSRKTVPVKVAEPDVQLQLSTPKKETGLNSNEKILELHKAGKSNMAIAKDLGLGIGEVKLVIDLNKHMPS